MFYSALLDHLHVHSVLFLFFGNFPVCKPWRVGISGLCNTKMHRFLQVSTWLVHANIPVICHDSQVLTCVPQIKIPHWLSVEHGHSIQKAIRDEWLSSQICITGAFKKIILPDNWLLQLYVLRLLCDRANTYACTYPYNNNAPKHHAVSFSL